MSAKELQENKIKSGEISNFFDCLYDILMKCSNGELIYTDLGKKYFSPFMLCRYISMKQELIVYAEYLNLMQTKLTNEQFYQLAYKLIPKQKTGFIKYIKKNNKKQEEKIEENINSNNMNTLIFDI
jgi:hypothetical protein